MNNNTRLRANRFIQIDEFTHIESKSPYTILLYAYQSDGTYLGYYGFYSTISMSTLKSRYSSVYYFGLVLKNNNTPSSNISSESATARNSVILYRNIPNTYKLSYGTPISDQDNLDDYNKPGVYYSNSSSNAQTLENCPTSLGFRMITEYSTGNDSKYILQNIRDLKGVSYIRTKNNNSWKPWKIDGGVPSLSYDEKMQLKELASSYREASLETPSRFRYYGSAHRNHYIDKYRATKATVENNEYVLGDKYILDCSAFAQMVWMGRSVDDFVIDKNSYSNSITTAFDWGYYFDFSWRRFFALGEDTEQGVGYERYYGFNNALKAEDYHGSISYNSYYYPNSERKYKQTYNQYMFANDMARELEFMGCGIPVKDLQVGDLIFTKPSIINPEGSAFSSVAYKNITHVAMVYEVNWPDITFIECFGGTPAVSRSGTGSYYGTYDRLRASSLLRRIVFCARHPHAFGIESNVPSVIESLGPAPSLPLPIPEEDMNPDAEPDIDE